MLVNLRGVRESGNDLRRPDVRVRGLDAGAHRHRACAGAARDAAAGRRRDAGRRRRRETMGVLLLMRAFADGCTRDHGRGGGVQRRPRVPPPECAQRPDTLTVMAILVGIMFLGTTVLAVVGGRHPDPARDGPVPARAGGVRRRAAVLRPPALDDGHPRPRREHGLRRLPAPASLLARDGFMPSRFAFRGERLAFTSGIVGPGRPVDRRRGHFGGRVEALIPLYAVGVFTSITLSQAGMVRHWWRGRGPGWRRSIAINGVGAVATAIVAVIFAVAKFAPRGVARPHRHPAPRRRRCSSSTAATSAAGSTWPSPRRRSSARRVTRSGSSSRVADVTRDVVHALTFARTMSSDVTAVHVTDDALARPACASGSSGRSPASRSSSSSRRTARWSGRWSATSRRRSARPSDDVIVVLLPVYVPRDRWNGCSTTTTAGGSARRCSAATTCSSPTCPYRRAA